MEVTPERCIEVAAALCGVDIAGVMRASGRGRRHWRVRLFRRIATDLLRKHTLLSWREVGDALGCPSHAQLYAWAREGYLEETPAYGWVWKRAESALVEGTKLIHLPRVLCDRAGNLVSKAPPAPDVPGQVTLEGC